MPLIKITINRQEYSVPEGMTVAAALYQSGLDTFRHSVTGRPRGPVCGMGICYECRLTINGESHRRSCLVLCEEGMEVETT